MISSVSTHLLQFGDAAFGDAHAALAFEVERLGDHTDREDADFARHLGDDRRRTGAGAAAHAGGDEHHMRAGEMIADLVDHLFGGRAADFGLRAGAETFGHLHAHLNDALGLRRGERLRVGVGDDEIDALQAGGDHVVDGVAARAADAEHGDARLQLTDVGDFQIDGHGCLFFLYAGAFERPAPADPPPAAVMLQLRVWGPSETLAKPSSDPGEIAARSLSSDTAVRRGSKCSRCAACG